jgi:hypothetical protein
MARDDLFHLMARDTQTLRQVVMPNPMRTVSNRDPAYLLSFMSHHIELMITASAVLCPELGDDHVCVFLRETHQ